MTKRWRRESAFLIGNYSVFANDTIQCVVAIRSYATSPDAVCTTPGPDEKTQNAPMMKTWRRHDEEMTKGWRRTDAMFHGELQCFQTQYNSMRGLHPASTRHQPTRSERHQGFWRILFRCEVVSWECSYWSGFLLGQFWMIAKPDNYEGRCIFSGAAWRRYGEDMTVAKHDYNVFCDSRTKVWWLYGQNTHPISQKL